MRFSLESIRFSQLFRLSRLSGQLLTHITLCISATSSEGLISSTLHSSSTLKRLAINYSSSLIVKLSSLAGSLVVLTSFSLVVHPAAFGFSGLALCLLHSEALPCPRPRGLMPSTGIVLPCFARPRFQLGLSPRAPPDLTKRARSTLSDKSWLAFITMYSTLQVLQRGHFLSYARFENCSPCLQLGSFTFRRERISALSDVSLPSSKTSALRPEQKRPTSFAFASDQDMQL